jgi:hypothetical protein
MDTGKFVTDRCEKRQNWEFGPYVTWRIACPINLRTRKLETVLLKISRDGGNVALSPAPAVDVRLIN